jgi:hypothetical protein
MYTALMASLSMRPVLASRCMPISCSSVSIATFVLPAPVGAHTCLG